MCKQLDLFGSYAAEQPVKPASRTVPDKQEQPAIPVANATPEPAHQAAPLHAPASPARQKKENIPVKKGKRGRKSIKEMDAESAMISIPEDEVLFRKQYYSIGEVAEMFNLNASLLRYWETEFDILQPRKNRKGDRHFRPEDIKNLFLIHHLLRQKKYTIEGAKDYLKKNKSKAQQHFGIVQRLEKLRGFLLELKAGL
ncbi:MerR family transcriptional regulator [Agriterribacter sp.]|uniref:MerR family transcriptional regulator n=1 Tax=Agriterribacter sp. TaxID=2821509 RepID=UPI002CF677BC|nr:MerR family transcriptional regulator [Agriterribacter sp.]HTN08591.1 MerR family transcriptional regulator [Agriterribacter sp.]